MRRLSVRSGGDARKGDAAWPWAVLPGSVAAIWGVSLLLRSVPGLVFSRTAVLAVTALLPAALTAAGRRGKRPFWLTWTAAAALIGLIALLGRRALSEQLLTASDALTGRLADSDDAVTGLAVLAGTALCLPAAAGGRLWGGIWTALQALLLTGALLCAPLAGMRLTAASVTLLLISCVSLTAYRCAAHAGRRAAAGAGPVSAGRCALAGLLAAGLACAAALPLRSADMSPLRDAVNAAQSAVRQRLFAGQTADPIHGGKISRGSNYPTGAAHLQVTVSQLPQAPLYLRGFAGGEYLGGEWERADEDALIDAAVKGGRWLPWSQKLGQGYASQARSDLRALYFRVCEEIGEAEPYEVQLLHFSGNYLDAFAPYLSVRVEFPILSDQTPPGYRYLCYDREDLPAPGTPLSGSGMKRADWYGTAEDAYQTQIRRLYTQVPAEKLPGLSALVQAHPLTDTDEITAFILCTLHSNTTYTLTPGWTASGRDIAEAFLFERQTGFCEHYAVTAALLYRLYGVPARYAAGYRADPAAFGAMESSPGWYAAVMTDREAHAWVEIFLPGEGWTPVEVTPAADGSTAAPYPGLDPARLQAIWKSHGWDVTKPSLEKEKLPASLRRGEQPDPSLLPDGAAGRIVRILILLLPVTALLLGALWALARRQRLLDRLRRSDPGEVLARLLELLRFAGRLDGCSGTEEDAADRIAAALPEVPPPDVGRLTEAAGRAAFSAAPPDADEAIFARRLYRRAAQKLYDALPALRKLEFRWVRVFG